MKTWTFIGSVLLYTSLGLFGCEANDGPFEKAGEKVDQVTDEAGDQMEEIGDTVEEQTDK